MTQRPDRQRPRGMSPWLGAPLVIAATWTLSAQASGGGVPPDVEQRLRALESLVRRGAGNTTQITAPFDVVGADGKPILRVSVNEDGSAPVNITKIPENGGGYVRVLRAGTVQAVMAADPAGGGVVSVLDAQEVLRAGLSWKGAVVTYGKGGEQTASLTQGGGGGRIGIWGGTKWVVDITTDSASGGAGVVNVNQASGQGTLGSGRGIVRTGPTYRCNSSMGTGIVGGMFLQPDCLVGFMK